jgi:hypothetical protein
MLYLIFVRLTGCISAAARQTDQRARAGSMKITI